MSRVLQLACSTNPRHVSTASSMPTAILAWPARPTSSPSRLGNVFSHRDDRVATALQQAQAPGLSLTRSSSSSPSTCSSPATRDSPLLLKLQEIPHVQLPGTFGCAPWTWPCSWRAPSSPSSPWPVDLVRSTASSSSSFTGPWKNAPRAHTLERTHGGPLFHQRLERCSW